MKKFIILTSIAIVLLGGVSYATTRPLMITPSGGVIQPAGLEAPRNKLVESQVTAQATQERAQAATESRTSIAVPDAATVAVDAETQPQSQPATTAVPKTVVNIIGSNVNGNARAGIDTFTCTYHFSDGTSESRVTQYTYVESSSAAAICPDWE